MTQAHALTAEQHRLMEGMAPFALADQAILPTGRKLTGTRARVYWLLRTSAEEAICHRIGEQVGPAGWVPGYYFQRAWSGGGSGDRRRRDLSEKFGVQIEAMRFSGDSSTVLYRWVSDPAANRPSDATLESVHLSRGFDLNSFSPERGTTGSLSNFRASTGRLRFWTSVGFPGGEAPGRLQIGNGGGHPLALGPGVFAHVVAGDLLAAAALAGYSATLKARWSDLRAWLATGGEYVLWIPTEMADTLNPLPLLVEILGKSGAEYLGEWQQTAQVDESGVA